MEVVSFKSYKKGALEGFMDIHIPELDWTLKNCSLFSSNGRRWVQMPTRSYQDDKGETKYQEVIQMPKELKNKFTEQALKAYKEFSQVKVEEPKQESNDMELPFQLVKQKPLPAMVVVLAKAVSARTEIAPPL